MREAIHLKLISQMFGTFRNELPSGSVRSVVTLKRQIGSDLITFSSSHPRITYMKSVYRLAWNFIKMVNESQRKSGSVLPHAKKRCEKKPHTGFWYAENLFKTDECFAWTGFGGNSISKTETLKTYTKLIGYSHQTPVFPNFRQSALIYQISDFVNSWDGKSSYGLYFRHVVAGMLLKITTARHDPKRTNPSQSNPNSVRTTATLYWIK